jgi:negative regulator of flagellin synthesis FlgM|tara:strand:- start:1002 stop:1304 length:303 start_codon:yes stop_codon:yes gene_type:complete
MIDQINKTLAKIDPQVNKNSKDSNNPKLEKSSVPAPADAIDSADLSKLAKLDNVSGLSSSAPIDFDQVNEIKNAIANGDYPIDADRIADALMDFYKEMKN